MKRLFSYLISTIIYHSLISQPAKPADTGWETLYRETATKINDLVHTKLDAKFDFNKSYMYGKVWITLQPHFYPTDSLRLDAKGMDIHKITIIKNGKESPLKYDYDNWQLNIDLDRTYKAGEQYTVFIDYTSKPDELKVKGSNAITDARGLYFINPKGEDKNKPTQIWTQGETEATSAWCPTIDKPNQKTTDEISMTVPDKYVTLSNGKLVTQKQNGDGTRTDIWKMDLPHAPYLFFMGAGDYSITKDSYKGKEVSYYVDKEYAAVARKIFGLTPEMIALFSKITGVDYPWAKYAQVTGHDYVSGAMENTTATLHSDAAQQDARELTDGNTWEEVISHELFHQWFGDYVTTESWSNITLNESFADYGEVLWKEYKYGKDAGDEHIFEHRETYLANPANAQKDLVRFYYHDKEDVFDQVSYPKGAAILHMLRNYVGDSAFFKALNLYLTTNKFKSAEAQQLRLAFEDVTGKDLNWFWNEWYYGAGHPSLDIEYSYDAAGKKVKVIVTQTQPGDKVFRLPVAIDIYNGAKKIRHQVWVQNKVDSFLFAVESKPDLVNFDGDKILLCSKKENKTLEEYIHQYKYAGTYADRREAVDFAFQHVDDPNAVAFIKTALKDKNESLRKLAIDSLDLKNLKLKTELESILFDIAKTDAKKTVRASAIKKLGEYGNPQYAAFFKSAINDSSYSVSGNAIEALYFIDPAAALSEVNRVKNQPARGNLAYIISALLIESGDESSADIILGNFERLPFSQNKMDLLPQIGAFLNKTRNADIFKRGIDAIVEFRDKMPGSYKGEIVPVINGMLLKGLATRKKQLGLTELANYVISKLPPEDKKGFTPIP
jgi:aminopeptidase N